MDDEIQLNVRVDNAANARMPILLCHDGKQPALDTPPPNALLVFRGPQGWVAADSRSGEMLCLSEDEWADLGGWSLRLSQPREATDGYSGDDLGALSILEDSGFPKPWLTIEDAGDEMNAGPTRVELDLKDGGSIVIGRKATGHGIRLQDRHVSREHLRISLQGDRLTLENLSRYPAKLNGQDVSGPTALSHNDRIDLGSSSLRFNNPMQREHKPAVAVPLRPNPPSGNAAAPSAKSTPALRGSGASTGAIRAGLLVAILLVIVLIVYLVVMLVKGG